MADEEKKGGFLSGLLRNPVVQGVGTAAAFGANPLLGLLAAPIIRQGREEKALQMQAKRNEIEGQNKQLSAIDQLSALQTADVQMPFGGTDIRGIDGGLLATTPSEKDVATPSDLMGPGTAPGVTVPKLSTDRGQREQLGLLMQLGPGAAQQGLMALNTPRARDSAWLREVSALFDMSKPEEVKMVRDAWLSKNKGSADFDDRLAMFEMEMNGYRLAKLRREEQEAEAQQNRQRMEVKNVSERAIDNVRTSLDLNRRLIGTAGEAGMPLRDYATYGLDLWERAASTIGLGDEERQQMLVMANRLDSNLDTLLNDLKTLEERAGGNLQLAEIRILENAKANPKSMNPYTLSDALGSALQQIVSAARINEVPFTAKEEESLREEIRAAKQFSRQGFGPRLDSNTRNPAAEAIQQGIESRGQAVTRPGASNRPPDAPDGMPWYNPQTGRWER